MILSVIQFIMLDLSERDRKNLYTSVMLCSGNVSNVGLLVSCNKRSLSSNMAEYTSHTLSHITDVVSLLFQGYYLARICEPFSHSHSEYDMLRTTQQRRRAFMAHSHCKSISQ